MIREQLVSQLSREISIAFGQGAVWIVNLLGIVGVLIILYGLVVYATGETYRPFEKIASTISNLATIFGVILTASSVYVPNNPRQPIAFSKYVSAWMVIVFSAVVGILYVCPGMLSCCAFNVLGINGNRTIPQYIFSGLGIVGLAGGLFRSIIRDGFVDVHSY